MARRARNNPPKPQMRKARGQNCARWRLLPKRKLETPIHAPKRAAMRGMPCHAHRSINDTEQTSRTLSKQLHMFQTKTARCLPRTPLLLPSTESTPPDARSQTDRKLNRAPPAPPVFAPPVFELPNDHPLWTPPNEGEQRIGHALLRKNCFACQNHTLMLLQEDAS